MAETGGEPVSLAWSGSRREWEEAMRASLEKLVRELSHGEDEVRLIGDYPDTEIAVVFRLTSRPGCVFGFSWGTFWDEVAYDVEIGRAEDWRHIAPDGWGAFTIAAANMFEAMSEPPLRCAETGVTWYSQRYGTIAEAARCVTFAVVAPTTPPRGADLTSIEVHPARRDGADHVQLIYGDDDAGDCITISVSKLADGAGDERATREPSADRTLERLEGWNSHRAWRLECHDLGIAVGISAADHLDGDEAAAIAASLEVVPGSPAG